MPATGWHRSQRSVSCATLSIAVSRDNLVPCAQRARHVDIQSARNESARLKPGRFIICYDTTALLFLFVLTVTATITLFVTIHLIKDNRFVLNETNMILLKSWKALICITENGCIIYTFLIGQYNAILEYGDPTLECIIFSTMRGDVI
jgi:hypothetical protein